MLLPAVLTLVALFPSASARASSVDQAVAYQADAAHDGHVTQAHLNTPLSRVWSSKLGGRPSYPLIVNGVVYVTVSSEGETKLDAIDAATGKTLWSQPGGSEGATYDEGRIFTNISRGAIAGDSELIAYDAATGKLDWARQPGVYWFTSPPTAADGILYFSGDDTDGALFAVQESDGEEIWSRNRGSGNDAGIGGDSSPAIANGDLYVDYECQQDFAFDALSGDQIWHHNTGDSCGGGSTPVVAEGLVYERGRFYGTPSGLLLSAFEGVEEGSFNGSGEAPAVADGTAYIPEGNKLVAVSDDGLGADLWTFEAGSKLTTAPLVAGNLVLVASENGELYALNASGEVTWSANAGVPIPGYEEGIVNPPGGMAAGEGMFVVPAGETLIAYAPTSALSGEPTPEVAPRIEGIVRTESQVAADVGVWTGVPTSYAYQWLACDPEGEHCSNIEGATSPTYTPSEAKLLGATLKVNVTATNAEGSASALSGPSSTVVTREPTSIALPTITGSTWVGYTLSADPGTWSGTPTSFEYQWSRCDPGECVPIPGAVRSTYTPTEEDLSHWLTVSVTPVDAGGPSPPATSVGTTYVTRPEAPSDYEAPKIAGTPEYPDTLMASPGGWSESPTSFDYQWFTCESGDSCSSIPDATGSTYELTRSDVGERIEVGVTARNVAGPSTQALSVQTAAVTTLVPENVSPPSFEGSLIVGGQLTANVGRWESSPTGYEYEWLRCEQKAELCAPIEGASKPTYKLAAADTGQLIAVAVVAHNAHGYSVPVFSEAEGPVGVAPIEPPSGSSSDGTPSGSGGASGGAQLSPFGTLTPIGPLKAAALTTAPIVRRVIFGEHVRTESISRLLSRGLHVDVKCADACNATASLTAPLGPDGRLETIGHVRASLTGGRERTVVVPVRYARGTLRSGHRITLTVEVTVTDASGVSSQRSSTVTL